MKLFLLSGQLYFRKYVGFSNPTEQTETVTLKQVQDEGLDYVQLNLLYKSS